MPSDGAGPRDGSLPAVLAFSHAEWGGMYSPVEPRLAGLARRGWTVLHSNGALSVWDRHGPAWAGAGWLPRFERRDGVLLHHAGRWPPRWPRWNAWDRLALRLTAGQLRRRAAATGSGARIAYLFHPDFFAYLPALAPDYVVFQVIDNYAHQPGWTPESAELLAGLVERADLLLVNNTSQTALLPGAGAAKARVLSNAVDYPRVAAGRLAPCPADLAAIPEPRIGYVGALNPKVDFPMIAQVAADRPGWHWVLIGPVRRPEPGEYPDFAEALDRCERLPNVHFLGYRDRHALPAYLGHMQVNTICYRLDVGHWTRSAYPFKVLECLAAGPPVVSTSMPEVLRHRDVMEFADSPAEWKAAIARVLSAGGVGSLEARQAVAEANSWDRRIADLDLALRGMLRSGAVSPGP